jgi:hypothetical protein
MNCFASVGVICTETPCPVTWVVFFGNLHFWPVHDAKSSHVNSA